MDFQLYIPVDEQDSPLLEEDRNLSGMALPVYYAPEAAHESQRLRQVGTGELTSILSSDERVEHVKYHGTDGQRTMSKAQFIEMV